MKIKLVYFSLDGNTQLVARQMAQALQAELVELTPSKPYPTKGFAKYFAGGKDVLFKATPALKPYSLEPKPDLLILGSPIWASTFAPPMRSFLSRHNLDGQAVAFFACHRGGGVGRCFTEFAKLQPKAQLIASTGLLQPTENELELERAVQWAKSIQLV